MRATSSTLVRFKTTFAWGLFCDMLVDDLVPRLRKSESSNIKKYDIFEMISVAFSRERGW